MTVEQQYLQLFSQAKDIICGKSSGVMNSCRLPALENFERMGFPTRALENYKYTDLRSCFDYDYGLNLNRLSPYVASSEVFRCGIPRMGTIPLFMVNDVFYPDRHKPDLVNGVLVGSLGQLSERYPNLVSRYYGKLADTSHDGITAFNTLFSQDGLFLYVPDGVVIDKPLQLVNSLSSGVDLLSNRRILIVLGQGATARLLLCDNARDSVRFLSTQVVEAYVGRDASLDIYGLEETHYNTTSINNLYIRQEANSYFGLHNVTLSTGVSRTGIRVSLQGAHAEVRLDGLVIADNAQHVDNNVYINHGASDNISNTLFKYILDDKAVGAFSGLVHVQPAAQGSNSLLTNRNLCASPETRMYTQPQLEIYADDVKCSHGATVGQLDEQALFYMRTRGVSLKEARLLLMNAFANEVLDSIGPVMLRERLRLLVDKRFQGELNKCHGCESCVK